MSRTDAGTGLTILFAAGGVKRFSATGLAAALNRRSLAGSGYLAGAAARLGDAGDAGVPVAGGAEPVVAGAVPVVVAGGLLLAVCGPVPFVPAYHQTPRAISTITMMPMIQPPEPLPPAGRRGEFGSYVDMGFASLGCALALQLRAATMRSGREGPGQATAGTWMPLNKG
jgi:hypothetical protein